MTSGLSGSMSKREENRRTLTDFKIVALGIEKLSWKWGQIPTDISLKEEGVVKLEDDETVKEEPHEVGNGELGGVSKDSVDTDVRTEAAADVSTVSTQPPAGGVGAGMARMRIYFHTPPSPDDARPIGPSDSRKGKRKKGDDDDAETDGSHRTRPPPAGPKGSEGVNGDAHGAAERGSVAPSVAETTSEGDWLMAAIAADSTLDDDADAEGDLDADGEEDAEGDYDDYEPTQSEGHYPNHSHDGEHPPICDLVGHSGRLAITECCHDTPTPLTWLLSF